MAQEPLLSLEQMKEAKEKAAAEEKKREEEEERKAAEEAKKKEEEEKKKAEEEKKKAAKLKARETAAKMAKLAAVEAPKLDETIKPEYFSLGNEQTKRELQAGWKTLKDARTIKLEVAGPRGQIVDRNGVSLAQTRVAYYLGMKFPVFPAPADAAAIAWARERLALVEKTVGKIWELSDKQITDHYENRRWLPLVSSIELEEPDRAKLKDHLGREKGLVLHPTFARVYPKLTTACHIVGYTGITRKLPSGPVIDGEPFTEEPNGRAGLEERFEADLRGRPGAISILFSPDGSELHQEWLRRPIPGNNVVTTLDYDMQRFAEDSLRSNARNGGAMVIMDVRNGDILAMASNPGYNLNDFVPRLSSTRYEELLKDPRRPLTGRAFQGTYYPASTFKIMTALSGLESGDITSDTSFDCDSSFQIGNRAFRNWNKEGEGSMNVIGAIKRSCNTWFYQAALRIGAARITNMAERFGFGQPTGIPIGGEAKGFLPTDAYYMQRDGTKILPGMLASIAIGQVVTATPLQVAQGMAGVADGVNQPKARLVKQVQDYNDNVVQAWGPEVRKEINLQASALETVRRGMIAVVQGDGGTGHSGQVSGMQVAGKTGTAQVHVDEDSSKNTWLAWFTGFLPARNPVYAFAVVYEGAPGEHVSGGSIAAPIVSQVFEKINRHVKADDPMKLAALDASRRAEPVDDEPKSAPKAEPVKEEPKAEPEPPATVGGFFKRLFGRKN